MSTLICPFTVRCNYYGKKAIARVYRKLNDLLRSNRFDPKDYTLHSFRKGAAQHAKDSGIQDDKVQALGRWTRQAF